MRKFAKSIGSGGQGAGRHFTSSGSCSDLLTKPSGEASISLLPVVGVLSLQSICGRPRTAYEGESDSLIKT
jgi:hypothetical protein